MDVASEQVLKKNVLAIQLCLLIGTLIIAIFVLGKPGGFTGMILIVILSMVWRADSRGFLVAVAPFIFVLYVFQVLSGFIHKYPYFPVHFGDIAGAERMLFGVLPSQWLQTHLPTGGALLTALLIVYGMHFVYPVLLALVLWFTDRLAYWRFIFGFTTMTYIGFGLYVLLPTAPPWYSSHFGYIPEHIDVLGTSVQRMLQWPNPIAAFPSLHAAFAAFIALFVIGRWGKRGLPALMIPLSVSFAVVYLGHHYVIDVLAGFLLAGFGIFCTRFITVNRFGRMLRT
jgi:membrane-associated phospholipid phosphatase